MIDNGALTYAMPYADDDDMSHLADPNRITEFEHGLIELATRLGFSITQFVVTEDRTGNGPPPRIVVQLEQGFDPDPVRARRWFTEIGAKVNSETVAKAKVPVIINNVQTDIDVRP
ncbi:hypothetical protein SE17_09955 [Kouleothrix aurantiaca]|uniref:Uncharacterized protein n=1 Tax=Kouleothrix aurantiaca TaxID=186479 RepID=A0A0N8PSQ6_9CHLR|nr:hypothetical protein SE17_09955 [Kouleothrix aurantiaca]